MLYLVVLNFISLMIPSVSLHSANAIFYNDSSNDSRHGSCRLRSVREAVDAPSGRSMTESFVLDDVEYKLCRYHVTWDEALVFCSTHKAHLATLDNDEKTSFVAQAIASSISVSEDYWIGARKYYGDSWTWDSNAKGLSSEMDIIDNVEISYPGDENNDVHCLTIDRRGHNVPIFVPRACNQRRGFICQRDNEQTFDNKIRMVAASRIGEQEFRLYSGRATWADAVVQCRQEGLQIGEVNTIEEARKLAASMLRNRPEGIESAWIGGYTRKNDPGTWRWLASGEKIKNNEMWQKNLTESLGGCLLLDRHLCDIPVYVETTCDRKRDVLCQKPPKKRLSKKPVEAVVEGCLYWIGFYPLKWSEARRSCNSLDASLVVLESPKTISHMMSLMLDNKSELRHIWTDGRRTGKYGRWQWEVNGEAVPTFAKSFIPWCPEEDNNNANGTDCLNLDRENLDSPLAYGLSCNERQSYVCQPRTGDCISRSTVTSGATETTIATKFQTLPSFNVNTNKILEQSKVTGTLPMTADYYVSTIRNTERYDVDSLDNWRSGESISSRNLTSGLSKYLKPFTRFTLPSFPQFGIKVASAFETTTTNPSFSYDNKRNKNIKLLPTSILKSAANSSSSIITTSTRKNLQNFRKASQVSLKKLNFSSVPSTYLGGGYVESTSRTSKNSKFISDKFEGKNLTKIGKTVSPESADSSIYSTENERRTRKYSQKTTRDLTSNLTKILPTTTIPKTNKDFNYLWNDEEINGVTSSENVRAETRLMVEKFSPNTLIRITTTTTTTALPMRLKKLRPTTEFTTPYDAIDEDYYENYETKQSTESNEDLNSELFDEYDESYDAPENFESKKRIKQTSTSSIRKSCTTARARHLKMKKTKKIPIAEQLSRNLQVALVGMLKNGIQRNNRTVSTEENVKPTMKMLPKEQVSSENVTLDKSMKTINITETWSLRPYYAFEGPMIVGLAESSGKNSEKSDESHKSHVFKFTGKKSNDAFANNEISDARRYFNNRGIDFREPQSDKTSNAHATISDLLTIRPNDPNSLMQMGRYFKNKFGNIVATTNTRRTSEKIGRAEESEEYFKGSERAAAGWPIERYRTQQSGRARLEKKQGYPTSRNDEFRRNRYENPNLNLNYYESARRLYPRGDLSLFSRTPMRTDERSWLDRLGISWPNFTNAKTSNLGQVVSERNFPAPIRTTRSFNDDSETVKIQRSKIFSFPDFKISKLIKEVKIDLDQRLLRNYLESLARRIARADNNSPHRKKDWRESWKYIVGQMSRILDGMSISVNNGDVMKVRVGSEKTREFNKIVNPRKIEWRKKLRKRKKDFDNFVTTLLRKKMAKINETSGQRNSSKFTVVDQRNDRVSLADKLAKQSSGEVDAKNHETTEGYSDDNSITKDSQRSDELERNSLEREIKPEKISSPKSSQSPSRYDDKLMMESRKFFLDRYRATLGPLLGNKVNYPRFEDVKKLNNWYRTKYPSFNNSRVLAAPTIFRSVGIPRIYGFQPMTQQLHRRLAFNPDLRQYRVDEGVNGIPQKASILTGEYLPKGTLSRIVSSENQRFNDGIREKNSFFQNRGNSSAREENYSHDHSRDNSNATSFDHLREMREDDWPKNFENKLENQDFAYYVNNENETDFDKSEDEFEAAEIENEEPRLPVNYQPKTIWSPSLRLGKAMELSNFRKFRQNPVSYLSTKNLVARSLRNDVISRKYDIIRKNNARSDNDRGRYEIIKNLENLRQEPSTVSLRMIINPDDEDEPAGARLSRQSVDSLELLKNPQTIELRLGFSGNEIKSIGRLYHGLVEDYRKELSNISTLGSGNNGTTRLLGPYDRTKVKITSRFIEKIRRREMMEKLREKSRKFVDKQIWQEKVDWKGKNASTIADSRDRKSRTAAIKRGNNSLEGKTLKNYSLSRPRYSASSASFLSFEDKNSTSKKRLFRDKDFNVDWSERAALLFGDSRENNDQLTLYVDLALGRVGRKLKRAGKLRT